MGLDGNRFSVESQQIIQCLVYRIFSAKFNVRLVQVKRTTPKVKSIVK